MQDDNVSYIDLYHVPLNLEETGWLCHAMMANKTFFNFITNRSSPETPTEQLLFNRQVELYMKLCMANDRLMGKTDG